VDEFRYTGDVLRIERILGTDIEGFARQNIACGYSYCCHTAEGKAKHKKFQQAMHTEGNVASLYAYVIVYT
jgi:hypothetical protein